VGASSQGWLVIEGNPDRSRLGLRIS